MNNGLDVQERMKLQMQILIAYQRRLPNMNCIMETFVNIDATVIALRQAHRRASVTHPVSSSVGGRRINFCLLRTVRPSSRRAKRTPAGTQDIPLGLER